MQQPRFADCCKKTVHSCYFSREEYCLLCYDTLLTQYWVGGKIKMRWAGHMARMGEGRGVHRVLGGSLRERDHWGDPDVDGRLILRGIFRKWEGIVGT
jgi:hypothetical protein